MSAMHELRNADCSEAEPAVDRSEAELAVDRSEAELAVDRNEAELAVDRSEASAVPPAGCDQVSREAKQTTLPAGSRTMISRAP